jgi:uncharacterized protein (DUF2252 family)
MEWGKRSPMIRRWPIAYASAEDQQSFGRSERVRVGRRSNAELAPATVDAVRILRGQEANRIADLIPLRYARMLASPFTFFRGAAAVMAADLAGGPRTDLVVQLCGDAHLDNFGLFASPERRLVFDLNDFDETYPGPFEWDVKRLAASFDVAMRTAGHEAADRATIVARVCRTYREAIRRLSTMTSLEVWYAHLDVDTLFANRPAGASKKDVAVTSKVLAKARSRDHLQAIRKLTTTVDGIPRFVSQPPILVPISELLPPADQEQTMAWIATLVAQYARTLPPDRRRLLQQYHLIEVARRVVGVGSVGTAAWVALFVGADPGDAIVLQAKEAQESVLAPYLPGTRITHEGRRVVEGQRLMQAYGDPMLGWKEAVSPSGNRRDYYLRQFRDWKGSFDSQTMSLRQLGFYADACGATLAKAHARSGDRLAIAAYLGKGDTFDQAISRFATAYADKNEADFALLRDAADRGEIAVADLV